MTKPHSESPNQHPSRPAAKPHPHRKATTPASPQGAPVVSTLTKCAKTFTRAGNFRDLLELVRQAERRLSVAGHTDVGEQISILRGLYYGTAWSTDFRVEKSQTRNAGFKVYTASPLDPFDPTTLFDCGLFAALQASQDAHDGSRKFDFGHAIIGLDCRLRTASRSFPVPLNGGSGLEICTWLGDLGGGAGMLAVDRGAGAGASALRRFSGSDYGGPINLEGDVAGFVIGHASGSSSPTAPTIASGGIATAIEKYLGLGTPSRDWLGRANTFLGIYGGTVSGGKLSNRAALIDQFSKQIESFAENYLSVRYSSGHVTASALHNAAYHLEGSANEVATIFVDALVSSASTGGAEIHGAAPVPTPSPPSTVPNLKLAALAATGGAL